MDLRVDSAEIFAFCLEPHWDGILVFFKLENVGNSSSAMHVDMIPWIRLQAENPNGSPCISERMAIERMLFDSLKHGTSCNLTLAPSGEVMQIKPR